MTLSRISVAIQLPVDKNIARLLVVNWDLCYYSINTCVEPNKINGVKCP